MSKENRVSLKQRAQRRARLRKLVRGLYRKGMTQPQIAMQTGLTRNKIASYGRAEASPASTEVYKKLVGTLTYLHKRLPDTPQKVDRPVRKPPTPKANPAHYVSNMVKQLEKRNAELELELSTLKKRIKSALN